MTCIEQVSLARNICGNTVNNKVETTMFEKGQSGNPEGRPKGAKNKRTLLRQALEEVYDDGEAGFWLAVAEKAKEWDQNAVALIAGRLVAPLKAVDAPVILDGLGTGSLTEQASNVLGQMGQGKITPNEATGMINAIAAMCRVEELDELRERVEALEEVSNG